MEKLIYETRPFLYLALSIYALFYHQNSLLMQFSGGLLLVSSLFIFAWRARHRGYIQKT